MNIFPVTIPPADMPAFRRICFRNRLSMASQVERWIAEQIALEDETLEAKAARLRAVIERAEEELSELKA